MIYIQSIVLLSILCGLSSIMLLKLAKKWAKKSAAETADFFYFLRPPAKANQ